MRYETTKVSIHLLHNPIAFFFQHELTYWLKRNTNFMSWGDHACWPYKEFNERIHIFP